jgi:hypothetical protein
MADGCNDLGRDAIGDQLSLDRIGTFLRQALVEAGGASVSLWPSTSTCLMATP